MTNQDRLKTLLAQALQVATEQDATEGIDDTKKMTPLRVKQAIEQALQGFEPSTPQVQPDWLEEDTGEPSFINNKPLILQDTTNALEIADENENTVFAIDSEGHIKTAGFASREVANKVDKVADKGLSTNDYTTAEKNKLSDIAAGAQVNPTAAVIKSQYESNANTNAFTDGEKSKLASLESSKFVGQYISLAQLQAAHTTAVVGSYAFVDPGSGSDVTKYIWDSSDTKWVSSGEVNQEITAAQVKSLYEDNVDTNAFTDTEKSKLFDIQAGAQVNVKPNWNAASGNVAEILNKPTIDGLLGGLASLGFVKRNGANSYTIDTSTYQPLDDDLTSIAGLSGTSGLLRKTASNTWQLDTSVYLKEITKTQVEAVLTGTITTHTHNASAIVEDASHRFVTDTEKTTWNNKVDKNTNITGATKTKITYDSKGLVTAGADLVEADIPTLSASKITQTASARFVTDTEKTTWNNKVDKVANKVLSTNDYTTAEKNKLSDIAAGAQVNPTAAVIKSQYESNANTNAFTDDEKDKLATLESSKFRGQYESLGALEIAEPSPPIGAYAYVDEGEGVDVVKYLWDSSDETWTLSGNVSQELTPSQVKDLYEDNPDTNAFTDAEKSKLSGIDSGAQKNVVSNWNATSGDALILNKPVIPTKVSDLTNDTGYITGYTETDPIFTAWNKSTGISITKSQVSDFTHDHNGLYYTEDEIDIMLQGLPVGGHKHTESDITDLDKYTQAQVDNLLNNKVDKVADKVLSTNDYTTADKTKLSNIAAGAEVNVQSDWNATSGDALILNKPAIPTKVSDLTNDTGYITGYTETDPVFTAWNKSTGISITKSQVSDLMEATKLLSGLMSSTDKQRLDVLHALLEEDTENEVVDSINEILAIFEEYPEGADLVSVLAGKVDKVEGKELSENDLTNTLKSNYDTAYTHSQSTHAPSNAQKNSDITKTEIEAKLTGEITSHSHALPAHTHTKSQITDFPTSMSPTAHTHDDRYYTETEVDTKLAGKQAALIAGDNINIVGNTISADYDDSNITDYVYTASGVLLDGLNPLNNVDLQNVIDTVHPDDTITMSNIKIGHNIRLRVNRPDKGYTEYGVATLIGFNEDETAIETIVKKFSGSILNSQSQFLAVGTIIQHPDYPNNIYVNTMAGHFNLSNFEAALTANVVKPLLTALDAPSDNKLYGRKNNTWEEVQGGGEVDLNEMAYFDYAGSIYGAKYSLLTSAWEHSLTVDPLEISATGSMSNSRGTAQYPNGETEGVIIPQGTTSIGNFAFNMWSSNNQPLVIPNSVTSIGANAFNNWSSNNQPLVIPNGVTSIGDGAFQGWSSNNQPLVIPNSVTSIEEVAFSSWSSNNQPLVIPNGVTSISQYAFEYWTSVPYVEMQRTTPPTLSNANAFLEQNNAPIYVPDASVTAYKTATNWVSLASRIFPISDKDNTYTNREIDLMIGDIESLLEDI